MGTQRLGDIALAIGAQLEGVPETVIDGMAELADARPSELGYAGSSKLLERVRASAAGAIIVGSDFPPIAGRSLLRSATPRTAFVRALELFRPQRRRAGIHASAVVAAGARIADDAAIGPCAVIESGAEIGPGSQVRAGAFVATGVRIGRDCDIGPNAVLLEDTEIGDRCILHPGVVIGADGYGFHWMDDHHHKVPQLGRVVIEDDVEIGANACIDRATLGETRVGRGSKFDNLVHVAHNTRIGRHVLLVGQVGVSGSCRLGDGVVAAGQAGIADHVSVGDGAQIGAQAAVMADLDAGARVWGSPARPMGRALRERAALARLPELLQTSRRQQTEIAELRDRIAGLEQAGAE